MKLEADLFEFKYLEKILGSFSKATGLHIEAVDDIGETFYIPDKTNRCEFCQYIRSHPNGTAKCHASYRQATLEAAKWEEPYFFRCHAGLVLWAVPIIMSGAPLRSIICGQVLMWKPDRFLFQELKEFNARINNFEELKEKAKQLEVISPSRSQAVADTLFVVVNHLIKRDIHILEQIDTKKKMQQQIRKDLQDRKKLKVSALNDYGAYLKKERSFLRDIRLGDKTRAETNLNSLLTYLFTKTVGDKTEIRVRVIELATLVSRAAVEGGADAEHVMAMLKEFNKEVEKFEQVEQFFCRIQTLVAEFLGDSLSMADKKHLSLVNDAKRFIVENHSKPIKIEDVAAQLFISASHLSRLFQRELNCTVNDYITRVRVERAVELMKQPELNVEQVSKAIGFQNQSYFAKFFRKYIGVTPLAYRNSLF